MHHFIFTLGSEFESIQNNYRIGCLPLEWQTTHWPSLLVLRYVEISIILPTQKVSHLLAIEE